MLRRGEFLRAILCELVMQYDLGKQRGVFGLAADVLVISLDER
jgi:hypothetical protein